MKNKLAVTLAATAFAVAVQLALTPVYLSLLGAAGLGLIGISAVVAGILQVFDCGLGTTVMRELAQASKEPALSVSRFCTLEKVSLGINALLMALLLFSSPLITKWWLHPAPFVTANLSLTVVLIVLWAGCRFQIAFYQSALVGLGKHDALGIITTAACLLGAGAVPALLLIGASVNVYFSWQLVTAVVQVLAIRLILPRPTVPATARTEWAWIRRVGPYAVRANGVAATGIMLTLLDRMIVSRMVRIDAFGYYVLGAMVANGLTVFSTPLYLVVFPRFAELVMTAGQNLSDFYHRSLRVTAALTVPPAAVLAVFAPQVLYLWTRNLTATSMSATVATVLTVGTALNIIMVTPYSLQMARGNAGVMLGLNVVLLAIYSAVVIAGVRLAGVSGAPYGWLVVNIVHIIAGMTILHRDVLRGEWVAAIFTDVAPPAVVAIAIVLAGRAVWRADGTPLHTALTIACLAGAAWIASGLTAFSFPPGRRVSSERAASDPTSFVA